MSLTADQLYELLPAVYRVRDAAVGEPLKALVTVIAEQAAVMEQDIAGLYENWFIETCDEWVAPYIGDLLAVRGLHSLGAGAPLSQRALVANTLSYRRRKGTPTMLERLAHDISGWDARAVEFFELLETTQHYNHIRAANFRTPDLRRTNELELLDTAFDTAAHTADVRRIATGRGRHNIPNIGLFIWRLQSYFVLRSAARAVASPADGRYTFSPLGKDAPLFNRPQTVTDRVHLAGEINVPGLLRRRPPYDELEARRKGTFQPDVFGASYFGVEPVLQIFLQTNSGDPFIEVQPAELVICNLTEPPVAIPDVWLRPPMGKQYQGEPGPRPMVAVDPERGRLALTAGVKRNAVQVSYAYGFSGDVGGGPYNRRDSVNQALTRKVTWQAGVSKEIPPAGAIFATLTDAMNAWNTQPAGSTGVIAIMDSATYKENLTGTNRIKIPEGSQLLIVAADWPLLPAADGTPGKMERRAGIIESDSRRPHVQGDITVTGTAPVLSDVPGELVLNGLLVEGKLTVDATLTGNLGSLRIQHSTLVPASGGLQVNGKNAQLKVTLTRSICGPVSLPNSIAQMSAEESIVDGAGGDAVAAVSTAVAFEKATVFGRVTALQAEAGNSIFTGPLVVTRRQTGCIRFSYLAQGSSTPRRFRCQPDLALSTAAPGEENGIIVRLVPSFTSEQYGHYGYAQLSLACAPEVGAGAEDGSEMGVFSFLRQPQRKTNLQTGLDEYLRFGLEAGIIFVT